MENQYTVDYKQSDKVEQILEQQPFYQNPNVEVSDSYTVIGQKALIASQDIPSSTVIFTFRNQTTDQRTRTSIQVDTEKHIEAGNFGSYTNHSCSPNSVIRSRIVDKQADVVLITLQDVKKGEELTFDYATTETDLTAELKKQECLCGSYKCRGRVYCFSDLSAIEQLCLIDSQMHAPYMETLCIAEQQ